MQAPFLMSRTYSGWLLKTGLSPFPCGPVPGNSLSAGTLISENQYPAG
jgi:hypothetical protein